MPVVHPTLHLNPAWALTLPLLGVQDNILFHREWDAQRYKVEPE